jgi:hypothetical protein
MGFQAADRLGDVVVAVFVIAENQLAVLLIMGTTTTTRPWATDLARTGEEMAFPTSYTTFTATAAISGVSGVSSIFGISGVSGVSSIFGISGVSGIFGVSGVSESSASACSSTISAFFAAVAASQTGLGAENDGI